MQRDLDIIARESHDPDTQTSCLIVTSYGATVSSANVLPDGVIASPERLVRPGKYAFIMHAERSAIALAARRGICLYGSTAYLNWFPCAECAGCLVQAGIKVLVADLEKYTSRITDPIYQFAEARQILEEGGVTVRWLQEIGK